MRIFSIAVLALITLAAPAQTSDPQKEIWLRMLKEPLQAADGPRYFESNVKDALLPGGVAGLKQFIGTVVAGLPQDRPSVLVLSINDHDGPDAAG